MKLRNPGYYFYKLEDLIGDRHPALEKVLDAIDKVATPLDDAYYSVKNFIFPHNVLRIESLGREYTDPVGYLLHANFQILKDFVEKEKPFVVIDWFENEETLAIGDEIKELYDWWVYLRPDRDDPWGERFDGEEFGPDHGTPGSTSNTYVWQISEEYRQHLRKCGAIQDKYDQEDQENLERLIKIREHLWT